jgi:hypothetical protein
VVRGSGEDEPSNKLMSLDTGMLTIEETGLGRPCLRPIRHPGWID